MLKHKVFQEIKAYVIILFSMLFLPQTIMFTEGAAIIFFPWGFIWPINLNPFELLWPINPFNLFIKFIVEGEILLLFYYLIAYVIILVSILSIYLILSGMYVYRPMVKKIIIMFIMIYLLFPIIFALKQGNPYICLYFLFPFNLSAIGIIYGISLLYSN